MIFQKYQTSSFDELVLWCDAIIIVYSISDRNSFAEAQRLKVMAKMKRRESKIIEVMTSRDLNSCVFFCLLKHQRVFVCDFGLYNEVLG